MKWKACIELLGNKACVYIRPKKKKKLWMPGSLLMFILIRKSEKILSFKWHFILKDSQYAENNLGAVVMNIHFTRHYYRMLTISFVWRLRKYTTQWFTMSFNFHISATNKLWGLYVFIVIIQFIYNKECHDLSPYFLLFSLFSLTIVL